MGGLPGVRDKNLLESIMTRQVFDSRKGVRINDVFYAADALGEAISQLHPFLDGNKRTALVSVRTLLLINGWELNFPDNADQIRNSKKAKPPRIF